MLSNILMVVTALFLFGLVNISVTPMPGGDRGVGHAYALFFCATGFVLLSGLLAWSLAAYNCFDWLPGDHRGWLVFFGWLAFAVATLSSAFFRAEWHAGEFPVYLRWFADAFTALWLPLLMLAAAVVLTNVERSPGTAPFWVQTMVKTGFSVSVLICAGVIFGYFRSTAMQHARIVAHAKERNDELHAQHLRYIGEQTLESPIVNILSLTGRFHDEDVRQAAIEKVKSHPDWEAELIRLLNETEWYSQAYSFIDGNQVEHPEHFVEPIKASLRRIAAEIKHRIKDSNNLQDWHFEHMSIERCLRAIDEQFSSVPGADFRAEVRAVRAALDTPKPERFQNVRFTVVPLLDQWLRKHP